MIPAAAKPSSARRVIRRRCRFRLASDMRESSPESSSSSKSAPPVRRRRRRPLPRRFFFFSRCSAFLLTATAALALLMLSHDTMSARYIISAEAAKMAASSSSSEEVVSCEAADGTCSASAAASASASGEGCVDSREDCVRWSNEGECDSNPDWMRRNCRKSCGTCGGNVDDDFEEEGCEDRHERCAVWADGGECEKNPGYMATNCGASCGTCDDDRGEDDENDDDRGDNDGGETGGEDDDDDEAEARTAEKEEEGIEDCPDEHEKCSEWAKKGECDKNPNYMKRKCRKSCGTCGVDVVDVDINVDVDHRGAVKQTAAEVEDPCKDKRTDDCPRWAREGECENNPIFMKRECAMSCRECNPLHEACQDEEGGKCRRWAEVGMCVLNESKMKRVCRESCGLCFDEEGARERGDAEEEIARKRAYHELRRNLGKTQKISGTKEEQASTKRSMKETDAYVRDVLSTAEALLAAAAGEEGDEHGRRQRQGRRRCRNLSEYCAYWAGQGRCGDQAEFMRRQCPLSCRFCDIAAAAAAG